MSDVAYPGGGPSVSVVVVTYNSEDTVAGCVASVPADIEVVLVDQGSGDNSIGAARAARDDLRLIRAGANRGFGAGCNLGAANAGGDVVVFLNPDAEVDADTLGGLALAVTTPGIGLAGPTIRSPQGTDVTRCRTWSSPARDALNLVTPLVMLPDRLKADIPSTSAVYATGGPVAYVQGSCMAIRRETFLDVGGFDEEFFIYGEEEWLASRLAARGLETVLLSSVRARHIGGTSTAKTGGFAVKQLYRARVLIYWKQGGPTRAATGSAVLLMALLLLLVTAPVRGVLRFRPNETVAWCRSAISGVASGLLRRRVVPPGQLV